MYSLNGIQLDNEAKGWRVLRRGTQVLSGISKELTKVKVPGYDGYFRAPSTRSEQMMIINVRTPLESLEELMALVATPTVVVTKDGDATREAIAELVSAIPSGDFPEDSLVDLTITLNVWGAAWRDVTATVYGPYTVADPVMDIEILTGISAPIRDFDVFLAGDFDEFELVDDGGSWLKSTASWTGSGTTGMLYVGSTGQTFLANTTSPWVPVSDAGHLVDVSGGGGFKITPQNEVGDPSSRHGKLTLTTLEQTSTAISIRAKGAYAMQYGG